MFNIKIIELVLLKISFNYFYHIRMIFFYNFKAKTIQIHNTNKLHMNYILFGDQTRNHLLPFTFTRTIADIRVGITTIREKWEMYLGQKTSSLTIPMLSIKYPLKKEKDNILINGTFLPNEILVKEIATLQPNQVLSHGDYIVALRIMEEHIENIDPELLDAVTPLETQSNPVRIGANWDIFSKNGQAIADDFKMLTKGRKSAPINDTNRVLGKENIFIEAGAKVNFATINAETGPVYIGKDAEIMEGSLIRGPFALGEGAVVRMGARIYGGTTIGPYSKVGGEISNSVIFGYTNKAHDGFMGNSVLGEWCNLGADTNTSNLKNNYEEVRVWDYAEESFVSTGLQFCGLFMGDHSKSAINTMFNTGTVVGVSANVFGSGFPRNFIPSFSWGGAAGFSVFHINKAVDIAKRVYKRRELEFNAVEEDILKEIYKLTQSFR